MTTKQIGLRVFLSVLVLVGASFLPIEQERSVDVLSKSEVGSILKDFSDEIPVEKQPLAIRLVEKYSEAKVSKAWKNYLVLESERTPPRFVIDDNAAHVLEASTQIEDGRLVTQASLQGPSLSEPLTGDSNKRIGDWISLLPPLIAVLLALAFQRILIALLAAVWIGVTLAKGLDPFSGIWATITDVLYPVLSVSFNLQILGFTFALVGMVSVVNRMGGTRGLIDLISKKAKDARQTQVATALMGLVIFFDDYANTVVVGSTARKLTDSMRISREKLAYIVDSTSAPIAGIALVSTWIGYEVGLFTSILPDLHGISGLPSDGYGLFFEALPLRFYCIFALLLVFLSALLKRDFGPMLRAERRARSGGPVIPQTTGGPPLAEMPTEIEKPGVPARWWNAALPILTVLVGTLGSIAVLGGDDAFAFFSAESWRGAFAGAEDEVPTILFHSALAGSGMAFFLAFSQRLLTPREALSNYGSSVLHLASAGAILILAWAIKDVCSMIGTGNALVALIGTAIPVLLLPLAIFVLSGFVAFFTGTSWGTMALLLPVAAPLAASLSGEAFIVVACVGAVLDGAIWGDHCSPISDTTVLSSTATGCPHVEHVRTQIPYAILAMVAAGVGGYLIYAAGLPVWVSYGIGVSILVGGLYLFGEDPELPAKERKTA